jgi:AraC-like DNA-binding protein
VSAYSTPWLRVGVYRCPPDSALWHETNDIGERPHVVFPATVVGLVRRGARVVATPNDVVFYRPHETYERALRDARGDVSLFIAPAPELLDMPGAAVGPVDAPTFLLARRLARALDDGGTTGLPVEEAAVELVGRALAQPARQSGRRPGTRRGRTALTADAKDLLLARLAEPLSLGALAGELHVSPFHLTRVFRECTGRTLTAYLHDLRLRAAVERLDADPGSRLGRVAADLGYCTPSHFTDRFRAAFGVPPSQLRNLMEAPPPAGP